MNALLRRFARVILPPRARWTLRESLSAGAASTIRQSWRVPICFRGAALPPAAAASAYPVPASFNAFLPTPLCDLMRREGSDKGMGWHNYTTLYHRLFGPRRDTVRRVFEMGLGTTDLSIPSSMGATGVPGASLRGWRRYFPHARVFGADIDPRALIHEDRIESYTSDQTDPAALRRLWDEHPELREPFDIVIDDGLHEPEANCCFFEHSFHRVAPGGVFIIEDVSDAAVPAWETELIARLLTHAPGFRFALVRLPHRVNRRDNNLVVAQRVG